MSKTLEISASICRDARTLLGMSQEELASAAEISVSTVRRCERGETISAYVAGRILAVLKSHGIVFVGGKLRLSAR